MDLDFEDMHGHSSSPNWGRDQCPNDFITQNVYFSLLMRVCVGLMMLAACTLLLISRQCLLDFSGIGFASHYQWTLYSSSEYLEWKKQGDNIIKPTQAGINRNTKLFAL